MSPGPRAGSDRGHEVRLLYGALTRAPDILIVTYSSSNDFIERMVKCGDAVGGLTLIGAPPHSQR
ncbi:MAG: hypothetical protein PHT99_07495, partial [Methanoregula sp.]|nr:hypothetical protein [Methanoregula sp.]